MSDSLEQQMRDSVVGSPLLAERLGTTGSPFLERLGGSPSWRDASESCVHGLARVVATSLGNARYLSSRSELLGTIRTAGPDTLPMRRAALLEAEPPGGPTDLEGFLDAIRLVRRDETALAACLHLGGIAPFEQVSEFLSVVAETCVRWALQVAEQRAATAAEPSLLAILGMGKIAGREFTYGSDLDLIFLFPDTVTEGAVPSRLAQRLIGYLASMTGAGVAYAVDSRLRPSGRQGALVSSYSAFARYQCEQAATWEHLAIMRSRVIAGACAEGQQVLDATRQRVLQGGRDPWPEVASMRSRVEAERGQDPKQGLAYKAGRGGLMDVEFLATGSMLERGEPLPGDTLPSIPAMLRAAIHGPRLERRLESYAFLRRVEACARWVIGRPVESLPLSGETLAVIAELVEPGSSPEQLLARIGDARAGNRRDYEAVIAAGTITALGG